jgi:hypothetical protein
MVEPDVQFKAVEAHPLCAYRNLGEKRAHLGVEPVPIHAEIPGRVLEPYNAGQQNQGSAESRVFEGVGLLGHVGGLLYFSCLQEY